MAIKLLIIGGVAGGATAAARARRLDEQAEIIVFERGGFISFANCGLPYHIGGEIAKRDDLLLASPELFMGRYNIEVRTFSEVTKIDRGNKRIEVKNLKTGESYTETYDKLILAPGAAPVKPPLDGIDLDTIFTLRNIPDTDRIKEYIDKNKPAAAVIVGAGFIGLEMAEQLTRRGIQVTVVEMLDQVLPPLDYEMAAIVHGVLREKGVTLRIEDGVQAFRKQGGKTVVVTRDGAELECDMVVLSIGVKPESSLARDAGLDINERGGIKTDECLRTSDPDIYAVGDAIETMDFNSGGRVMVPLGGPANKQARIAADNVMGRAFCYTGVQATAVVRVFDTTVAITGSSEKILRRFDKPYCVSYTHSASHASYYPGANMMAIKLIFEPEDGFILGAQIVGADGVDKRIDVIAAAIRGGMTIHDLEEFELAYAPPFGSAKDPVNIAGYVAGNILIGDVDVVQWHEVKGLLSNEEYVFLDVRAKEELEKMGCIEGAMHIPLPQLRGRMGELDKGKIIVPYCAIGLRGYLACRILTQNGYRCKNLSGGYKTYIVPARERGVAS